MVRRAAAALGLLIGMQLAGSGEALSALAIDPKTKCCKIADAIEPLKGITTLAACEKFCKGRNQRAIQLGAKSFACRRPKYACDEMHQGEQCIQCYKKGTCFLMPYVGGISSSRKVELNKLTAAEREQRERVFKENQQGVQQTGLGGTRALTGQRTGKTAEDERKSAKILTKRVTNSLSTSDFGGFPKGAPLGKEDFLSGAAGLGAVAGRIGRNGAIQQTHEVQLAKRKQLKNTNKQETNRQQENFAQDLGRLGPGQRGSFVSKGSKKELRTERARRAQTERAKTESKKLSLSGTAAQGFPGGGGGPVELTQQKQTVIGKESELKEGTVISAGNTKENLRLASRGGGLDIASLERRSSNKNRTQTAIRGRVLAKRKLRQAATDQGLNQVTQADVIGQRETNTAASQAGNFVQLEKKGKKCDHCTSTLQKLTKGTTYGRSRERLQEQTRERNRSTLRGRAGQGATFTTAAKRTNRYRRAKQSLSGSNVQEKYKGANSYLSPAASVRGKVSGTAATRTKKRSYQTEEGVTSEEAKELQLLGMPTTH